MTKSAMEIIKTQEQKIAALEMKVKTLLDSLEVLISGNFEKVKESIPGPTDPSASILQRLVKKIESANAPLPAPDEKTEAFLQIIIENMPFPVFIKDEASNYIYVNRHQANLFGLKESDILGKHDRDFVQNPDEMEIIVKSDEDVLLHEKGVVLSNQKFTLEKGDSYIFRTHKTPFTNPFTRKTNILGFSVEVTDSLNLEKLKNLLAMNSNPYH